MTAKLRCSACGAEHEKLTIVSGGKHQWIFSILAFLPVIWIFWSMRDKDFSKDLELRNVQKHISDSTLTVVGAIHNSGGRRWEHPTIEAEFYSESGQFLGELSERVDGSAPPRSDENFSLSFEQIPGRFMSEKVQIKIKITDALSSAF
jgi:hypothetical protein